MNRREFLGLTGVLLPGSILMGCGSSSDVEKVLDPGKEPSNPPAETTMCSGEGAVIYTNPGHAHTTSALSLAEIDAAVPGDYNLMGGDHSHMVTITAQNFTDILAGTALSLTSDTHGHVVTIQCPTA